MGESKSEPEILPITNEVLILSSDSEDEDRIVLVKYDKDDQDPAVTDTNSGSQFTQHQHNHSYDITSSSSSTIHHQSSLSENFSSHKMSEPSESSKPSSFSYTCQLLNCLDSSNVSFLSNLLL